MPEDDDVVVNFEARTGRYNKEVDRAQNRLRDFARRGVENVQRFARRSALALAGAAAAFSALVKTSATYVQTIQSGARATNTSLRDYQRLSITLESLGRDGESAVDAMQDLQDRIQELRDGTSTYIEDFALLNLSYRDFVNLAPDEAVLKLSRAVRDSTDATRAQAAAARILPEFQQIIVDVADAYDRLIPRLERTGGLLEDSDLDRLNDDFTVLASTIRSQFVAGLEDLAGEGGDVDDVIRDVGTTVRDLTSAIVDGLRFLNDHRGAVAGIAAAWLALASASTAASIVSNIRSVYGTFAAAQAAGTAGSAAGGAGAAAAAGGLGRLASTVLRVSLVGIAAGVLGSIAGATERLVNRQRGATEVVDAERALEAFVSGQSRGGFLGIGGESFDETIERIFEEGGPVADELTDLLNRVGEAQGAYTQRVNESYDALLGIGEGTVEVAQKVAEAAGDVEDAVPKVEAVSLAQQQLIDLYDPVGAAFRRYQADLKLAGDNTDAVDAATRRYVETVERLGREALDEVADKERERLDALREEAAALAEVARTERQRQAGLQTIVDQFDPEGAELRGLAEQLQTIDDEIAFLGLSGRSIPENLLATRDRIQEAIENVGADETVSDAFADNLGQNLANAVTSDRYASVGEALTTALRATFLQNFGQNLGSIFSNLARRTLDALGNAFGSGGGGGRGILSGLRGIVPFFHGGGVFRDPRGEGLAVLRDGEEVLTPAQRNGRTGGGVNVGLYLDGDRSRMTERQMVRSAQTLGYVLREQERENDA